MGLFSSGRIDSGKRRADIDYARTRMFGAQAIEEMEHAKARRTAAEQARMGVEGLLGSPGSYDLPGTAPSGGGVPGGTATGRGIFAAPTGPS